MRYFLISALLFTFYTAFTQSKYDNIWVLGYAPNIPQSNFGGSLLDFSNGDPSISFFNINFDLFANTSICDTAGKLLFYSNACDIMNAQHQLMINGDSINPGEAHEIYCDHGYPILQSVMSLPIPGTSDQFAMLHLRYHEDYYTYDLLYSSINMAAQNGLGQVMSKNNALATAKFVQALTAVRHGNGRDWWIVLPETLTNRYWIWQLTPQGFIGPEIRQWGINWNNKDYSGSAVFTPDGTKYISGNPGTGVKIASFDRCSGQFNLKTQFNLQGLDSLEHCSFSVSPNSRFLYLTTAYHLYQYDLVAANIKNSRKLIAIWDGYYSPFKTTFFHHALAPDGKIYISTADGTNVLHVINNPNGYGNDCQFSQHEIQLPTYMAKDLPTFPNFRLYDLPGSVCDTLGINAPTSSNDSVVNVNHSITIAPNPATGIVRLERLPIGITQVRVCNTLGQVWILQLTGNNDLDLSTLPSGLYFLNVFDNQGQVYTTKPILLSK